MFLLFTIKNMCVFPGLSPKYMHMRPNIFFNFQQLAKIYRYSFALAYSAQMKWQASNPAVCNILQFQYQQFF